MGGRIGQNRTAKAAAHQAGQVSAVIKMSVRECDPVDGFCLFDRRAGCQLRSHVPLSAP